MSDPTPGNLNDTLDRLIGKDARSELARERDKVMTNLLDDQFELKVLFDRLREEISIFSDEHTVAVVRALRVAHELGYNKAILDAPKPSARTLAADLVDAIVREVKR